LRTTCSFDGGTFVKTLLGYTQIKDIRAGQDKVWSRDTETGEMGYRLVEAHYSNPYDVTVKVSISDVETNKSQTLVSNKIHPFFVQLPEGEAVPESSEGHSYSGEIVRGAWVDASNLKAGYRLLNDDGSWATVTGVAVESTPLTAYNLTVEGYHTYFVTGDKDASPVWVHNTCRIDANGLPVPGRVVNSNLPHAAAQSILPERGVFSTVAEASTALRNLSSQIERSGFPSGTIRDTTRSDSFLVPVGRGGYAVYRLQPNGTAVLRTVLKAR
jgi:hypothetical protein